MMILVKFSENLLRSFGGNTCMKFKNRLVKVLSTIAIMSVLLLSAFTQEAEASDDITSEQLVTQAKKLLGVDYRYGGKSAAGFDCSGYVGYVYNQLGINLPRSSSSMYGVGKAVAKANLAVGDLVFFNTTGRGISHVGIYIGSGRFIHSESGTGVTVDSIHDKYYWGHTYVGAKRVTSVD